MEPRMIVRMDHDGYEDRWMAVDQLDLRGSVPGFRLVEEIVPKVGDKILGTRGLRELPTGLVAMPSRIGCDPSWDIWTVKEVCND